jgi:ribonuclease VapC
VAEFVLDASALMAFLRSEPGGGRVGRVLGRSLISAVNLAEVVAKAIDYGASLEAVSDSLVRLPLAVEPFAAEDAYISGMLRRLSRPLGLSLGDRCCLALGVRMALPVLTAEGKWAKFDAGVKVEVIR